MRLLRTNLKLNPKQRKMVKLANELWKKAVTDEKRTADYYRRVQKKLEDLEFSDLAEAVGLIIDSEMTHKDIFNDIIYFLKDRVILERTKS